MLKRSTKKRIAFISANAILIIGLFLGIVYYFVRMDLIVLPPSLLRLIEKDNMESVLPGDEGKIYQAIQSGTDSETVALYPDINKETALQMISEAAAYPKNYYQEASVSLFADGKTVTKRSVLRVSDEKFRVECYNRYDTLERVVVQNDTQTLVRNYTGAAYSETTFARDTSSPESEAGFAAVSQFVSSSAAPEYAYTFIESEWGKLILVQYVYDDGVLSQLEDYWIHLDYGIVVHAESYHNGELTYRMETTALSPLQAPTDGLFD